jgi:GDPmannose 4,6-dehydratase
MKKAFITGVTGQDGSYLVEYLIANGYEVHGRSGVPVHLHTQRIDHLYRDPHNGESVKLHLHYGDIFELGKVFWIIMYNVPSR